MTVQNLNQIQLPVYDGEAEKPKSVVQYGLPLRALLSNFSCIFGLQSGVAALNPRTKIRGVLQKRLPVSINWDRLPMELKDFFRGDEECENKGKDALIEWVETQIAEYSLEDRVFHYGEEILGFHWEPEGSDLRFDYTLLKNSKMNQPLIPRGIRGLKKTKKEQGETDFDLRSDIIKLDVICDLDVTSQWWKLRGDGIKATTCPIPLRFFPSWDSSEEVSVEWDILFGIESLKGGLAYLSAFVNSQEGGGIIDVEQGTLTLKSEQVISLDDRDGPVQKWIRENTHELWVEFRMINAEFRSLLVKRDAKSIALEESEVSKETDIVLLSIQEDYVLLRERIQVLALAS